MEERRAARRRKILQNAEDRLKKVVGVQSEARNNTEGTDGGNETENERQISSTYSESEIGLTKHLTSNDASELGSDAQTSQRISKATESTNQDKNDSQDADNDSDRGTPSSINNASKLKQDSVSSSEGGDTTKKAEETLQTFSQAEQISPGDPIFDSDNDAVGPILDKTDNKFYRMILIIGLAILLVLISNMEVFKETRYEAVRDASFLPYFITLEIINLCLFPVNSDIENSSVTLIIFKATGLTDQAIKALVMLLRFLSRTLQDFALFIFTIVLTNQITNQLTNQITD